MKNISVIIPCYNCASFIVETLDSLKNQSYKEFEIICINDGSTDNTLEVLEEYKKQNDVEIVIVTQENGGVSRARNTGIENSCGEYILFLDSDDLYHPEFVEKLYNAMVEKNVDVAYCRLSRNYDEVFKEHKNISFNDNTQNEIMSNLLYRMAEFGFYCYMYKKEVLLHHNINFDVDTRHFEDREFNWKYLCHCYTAVLVDAPLYFYRVNESSVTRRRSIKWRTDGLDAVLRVEAYLKKQHCEFADHIKSYLFPRVVWSMAKNYSLCKEKSLFQRFIREYDVKSCMKRTAKDKNKLVSIASFLYLIHPMLFYYIVGLKK